MEKNKKIFNYFFIITQALVVILSISIVLVDVDIYYSLILIGFSIVETALFVVNTNNKSYCIVRNILYIVLGCAQIIWSILGACMYISDMSMLLYILVCIVIGYRLIYLFYNLINILMHNDKSKVKTDDDYDDIDYNDERLYEDFDEEKKIKENKKENIKTVTVKKEEVSKALIKLKELYDKGIITEEEYKEKRAKYVDLL